MPSQPLRNSLRNQPLRLPLHVFFDKLEIQNLAEFMYSEKRANDWPLKSLPFHFFIDRKKIFSFKYKHFGINYNHAWMLYCLLTDARSIFPQDIVTQWNHCGSCLRRLSRSADMVYASQKQGKLNEKCSAKCSPIDYFTDCSTLWWTVLSC